MENKLVHRTCSEIKDLARGNLMRHYSNAVTISVVFFLLQYLLNSGNEYISDSLKDILSQHLSDKVQYTVIFTALTTISTAVISILLNMVVVGIGLFFLKLNCGVESNQPQFFYAFREDPGKFFCLSAAMTLPGILCMLPYDILCTLYLGVTEPSITAMITSVFIVGVIASLFFTLRLGIAFFLALDFPNNSASEILATSWKKMEGNTFRFFLLQLSFLPIALLAVLSFGVGMLWVYPYLQASAAMFYLDLMNPKSV